MGPSKRETLTANVPEQRNHPELKTKTTGSALDLIALQETMIKGDTPL
jgi:hypothetical protein